VSSATTTVTTRPPKGSGPTGAGRLSGPALLALAAFTGLVVLFATDQIVPASSERQAELRLWLAARATGVVALLLLTAQVALGLVLSHPVNKSTWKLSKAIFPWHDHIWTFIAGFLTAHVASVVLDPFAGVGLGAFIPGISEYRSVPVALGTFALYAFLIVAVSARWTTMLPRGAWLVLHRLSIGVLGLAWTHGVLAGTDSGALEPIYVASGLVVLAAAAYRYWAVRQGRPTFATSLPEVPSR
jgi:predicted ferric reductase